MDCLCVEIVRASAANGAAQTENLVTMETPEAEHDVVVSRARTRKGEAWGFLLGLIVGVGAFFLALGRLPRGWMPWGPQARFLCHLAGAWVAGWLTNKVVDLVMNGSAAGRKVVLDRHGVRFGARRMSHAEALDALCSARFDDKAFFRTLTVLLARAKAKRAKLPVRDLHAMVAYIHGEGLRGPMESSAWAMVDKSAKPKSAGANVLVWVDAGKVVRAELTGGHDADERGTVSASAVRYVIPTRFELPEHSRAYIEPQFDKARRSDPPDENEG